ncbi:MAG: PAS domain S-box protein, partial [Verrucomicrobiota bacterium]
MVGCLTLAFVYIQAREAQVETIRTDLKRLASLAAAQIDGNKHTQIRSPQQAGTFVHELLLEPLINFHNATDDILRLYTMVPREGNGYTIILDTTQMMPLLRRKPADLQQVALMEFFDGNFDPDDALAIASLGPGDTYATLHPYTDRFGTFMSGFATILDDEGSTVGLAAVDLAFENYERRMAGVRDVAFGGVVLLMVISLSLGMITTWVQRAFLNAEDVKNRARRRSLQSLEELEYNQKLLKAIAEMNRVILSEPNLSNSIQRALRIVGEAAGVDRVYLMEHELEAESGDYVASERFDWCRAGIQSHREDPRFHQLSYRRLGFSHWYETFKLGHDVIGHVRDMSSAEAVFLSDYQVRAIFCCPILLDEHCWGYMALEDCSRERNWTEEQRAIIAASARNLGAAIKRRQEEEARHVADARFRAIFERTPIGMVVNDTEGNFEQANQAFLRILGYTAGEIRRRNYRDFIPEDRLTQLDLE